MNVNIDNKPFIHLFRTVNGYYFFDVNTSSILKIPQSTYDYLSKVVLKSVSNNNQEVDNDTVNLINSLVNRGFLSSQRISEITHPADQLLPYYLNNKLKMMTLQVTQACNLRCSYCVYSGNYVNREHGNNNMKAEIAKKAVDFFINRSIDSPVLNIGFYGGEPLLRFDLIKEVINYVVENYSDKKINFNITTNGTMLNKKVVDFFFKHRVVTTISLDGPKQIHDKNRRFAANNCSSFDKVMISLEMIKKEYPDYIPNIRFNVVIDPENDFSCTNEFFTNYDGIKEFSLTSSEVSDVYAKKDIKFSNNYVEKRNYEVFKFFLWKINKLDRKYVSNLVIQYEGLLKTYVYDMLKPKHKISSKGHHGGPCIPGVQRLFVNYKGDFYPCERVSEISDLMRIGSIDEGFDVENIRRILNIGKITKENCKNCWAFKFCQLCAAVADDLTDFSAKKKLSNCAFMKYNVEEMFMDYCFLREQQCDFDTLNII